MRVILLEVTLNQIYSNRWVWVEPERCRTLSFSALPSVKHFEDCEVLILHGEHLQTLT